MNSSRRTSLSIFVFTNNIDIICLSKTWLTINISDSELFLPGFNIFRSDRNTKQNEKTAHGGVLIATKSALICYEISLPDQFQGYCTAIIWESSEATLLIATCYFRPPNSKDYLEPFHICQLMDLLSTCNANHRIINGDFNLSSNDWSIQTSEPLHQCILDKIDKLSIPQTVHFKTTNSKIVDLVLVSNQVGIIDNLTLDVFTAPKSDHKTNNSIIRIKELKKSSTFSINQFL